VLQQLTKRLESDRQGQEDAGPKKEGRQSLDRLAELEAKTREQFKRQRQALMEQLKKLEAEERDTLRKLRNERNLLSKQQQQTQNRPEGERTSPSGGDKLDRILERLDRMERRLQRLEQGRKQ
jgi:hypothetical protein